MTRSLVLALALVGCGDKKRATPTGAQLGAALSAALTAASHVAAPWRCAALDGPLLAPEVITLGEMVWTLAAQVITLQPRATVARTGGLSHDRVIGVIADAGGAAPMTLAALGRLRDQFGRADVVFALGGMGTTKDELVATLGVLASDAKYLLIALPGDLEDTGALAAAVTTLRARGRAIVDGRLAQRVVLGGAMIAVVPGASALGRLVATHEGCVYPRAAIGRAIADLAPAAGIRILASAEAPRQTGADGEATGELEITTSPGAAIEIALHAPAGPSTETASRARTGRRDAAAIALTPGSADASVRLSHPLAPDRRATAGLLTVRGDAWTWKPLVDTE